MYKKMVLDGVKPDNVTYYTLIQGSLTQNQQNYALDLLKEAMQISQSFKATSGNVKTEFTDIQKSTLLQIIKNLMLDENNLTAVNRYSDLVFIMKSLDPYSEMDKENSYNVVGHLKVHSKPFIPFGHSKTEKSSVKDIENRSPLVDLLSVPASDTNMTQSIFHSDIFKPNFDFLMPSTTNPRNII